MPVPEVGQIVHLENVEGRLVVKEVDEEAQTVDLVSAHGTPRSFGKVPVADLLPGEDLSAG
ncbi:hypothetical protein JAO29_12835 [Edaphobacter sp. HDX4]|jgi:hypothetical protein|uniref:hypothetical protein n=1 Tax=Edaphobacter sp. HDX4 TaxID=2794064 RepID=UPI002FE528A7